MPAIVIRINCYASLLTVLLDDDCSLDMSILLASQTNLLGVSSVVVFKQCTCYPETTNRLIQGNRLYDSNCTRIFCLKIQSFHSGARIDRQRLARRPPLRRKRPTELQKDARRFVRLRVSRHSVTNLGKLYEWCTIATSQKRDCSRRQQQRRIPDPCPRLVKPVL